MSKDFLQLNLSSSPLRENKDTTKSSFYGCRNVMPFLLVVVVIVMVACRAAFPAETSNLFHLPDDLDRITATEWILFRIFLLVSFVWALYEVLKQKVG